jgi:hypothetical protein
MADETHAAGWVSPEQHQQAVRDAEKRAMAEVLDRASMEDFRAVAAEAVELRGRLAKVEAERDEWQRRHARVRAMYRDRFNAGLSDADWHAQHCGAMAAVERMRGALQELASRGCHLDTSPTLGGRLGDGTDPGAWMQYLQEGDRTVREIARRALDATKLPGRKRDGGE